MKKTSKIYIAGHAGLVGSALVKKLKEKAYNNLILRDLKQLDLRSQQQTEKFFSKEKPEYVFLAAAHVGGVLANNTYKAEFIYDNIMIAANVIQAARKFKVKKLLNLGSSCIYPKLSPQPMKEEYLLSGKLEPTNEPYAVAKIAAIKLCRYYNEQYGTDFISVMPTNLYGPNDNFNLETSHVIPAMMRKFYLAKLLAEGNLAAIKANIKKFSLGFNLDKKINLNSAVSIRQVLKSVGITENEVTLWGSGEAYREFLFSEDLADACVFLMEKYDYRDIGEFVNIGSGHELKAKDLATIIKRVAGFKGSVSWDKNKPEGSARKFLDTSKITSLGWSPKLGLREGLKILYGFLAK